jgi:hypothetical protein
VSPQLFNSKLVRYDKPEAVVVTRSVPSADNTGMKTKLYSVPYAFLQTGNSLFGVLAACIGSAIGRILSDRSNHLRPSASAVGESGIDS